MGDETGGRRQAPRGRALTASEIAWLAVVPCSAAAALAIVALGPPLGQLLFRPGSDALWPPGWWEARGNPEPAKQGRYVLALVAALLPAAAVLVGARRAPVLRPGTIRALSIGSHAIVLAVAVGALVKQRYPGVPGAAEPPAFGAGAILAAAALVGASLVALANESVRSRIAQLTSETRGRRWAGLAIVLVFSATWLLKALKTDRIAALIPAWNLPWTLDDAFAVLDGRTPLVDYHIVYGKLAPYPAALALALLGKSAFVYSALMAVLTGLALLAVYAVFRLITRSSLLAVALFVPFVAVSDIDSWRIGRDVVSPMTLPAMWPMRYGGAFLVAWLTARHVDGRRPRDVWVLFLVGGLVAINNLEFGIGAVLALVAALLCARPPRSRRDALRLAAHAGGGLLGAIAAVSLLTLARAGALPDPALLTEWPRIFMTLGWFALPLPTIGAHLAIYATFVAAITLAAVRVTHAREDVLLTSMLAWSGVFGLLASGYFVARPDAFKLDGMLGAWGFALALLTVATAAALGARGWRRPSVPQLLVLLGFGLAACSLARLSPPQEQIARLTRSVPESTYQASAERFLRAHTRPGETVAILVPMGHRIAYDLGLRNVAPYAFMNAIVTRAQLQTVIDVARREHVRKLFIPAPQSGLADEGDTAPEQLNALVAAGYEVQPASAEILELRTRPE